LILQRLWQQMTGFQAHYWLFAGWFFVEKGKKQALMVESSL
jgi:hypothetical protein